jgi:hypothetical protein
MRSHKCCAVKRTAPRCPAPYEITRLITEHEATDTQTKPDA